MCPYYVVMNLWTRVHRTAVQWTVVSCKGLPGSMKIISHHIEEVSVAVKSQNSSRVTQENQVKLMQFNCREVMFDAEVAEPSLSIIETRRTIFPAQIQFLCFIHGNKYTGHIIFETLCSDSVQQKLSSQFKVMERLRKSVFSGQFQTSCWVL